MGHLLDGKLNKWLEDRYYDEELDAIEKLSNYGLSWTIRSITGENNDETEYFRNRFIENVSASYSYGKEIVVASKNKLYLVDCESLKKKFVADYSYYVI